MADLRTRSYHLRAEPLPVHRHQTGFVALVERGGYLELSADGVFRCEPGTAVVHPPFHQHANQFLHSEVRVVNIEVPLVSRYRVVHLSEDLLREARQIADPAELLDLLDGADRAIPEPMPSTVLAVADSLRSNPDQRVGDLAAAVGVSAEHLARLFKRYVGLSPSVFRSEQRLRRALADLVAGRPASSVAHRWGYSDQSHLCRDVKMATGYTVGGLKRSDFFKTGDPGLH